MEFLCTVWENLQTSVSRLVFNNVILNEEMEVLIKKVEDLVSLEKDMTLALDNLERQHGKKRRGEVNIWWEKVQRTKNKVGEREQQVRRSRYIPQWWLQWIVRNDIREVSELFEQGKFREGLLISDEDDYRGEVEEYSQEVLEDIEAEHSEGSISPGYYWTENQSEEESSESIPEEIELNKVGSSEKGLLTGKSAEVQEDTAEGCVQDIPKYDVFLSFRATGACKNFTDHLYKALRGNNIEAFIDLSPTIERGEKITPFIEGVIEGVNLSIIVFSSDYAFSTLCLDEIAKIMECRASKGQIVIPIFYKVDPLLPVEIYEKSIARHEAAFLRRKLYAEKTIKEDINRMERWKSAFRSALELASWHIPENCHEARFVGEITRTVLTQLKYNHMTMGIGAVESEMAQVSVENVTEMDSSFAHEKENGKIDKESGAKEDIKFGSIGQEHGKKEGNDCTDANIPKDAVDEWPAPKQMHTFYFVKSRRYDDPKIQAKITVADKEIVKCNKTRIRIMEELKAKRSERQELIIQVKVLQGENKQYQSLLDEKKKEMEPLQQALGKLRATGSGGRGGICSSEEELNDLIYSLQYRIQHESIPLTEEKQILREIKQLEGTREKVIANAAMRAKIQDSLGQKEAIQDQVKLIGGDLDGVRKEKQAVWQKISGLDEKVKALAKEIESLQKELEIATEKRENAYQSIKKLRNQRDEGNTQFFHSRTVLAKARELAAKKEIAALGEFSNTEIDEFISQWCNDKAFRDDYEKRILPSLDSRMLSRDGRMRNPEEKPLVVVDTPVAPEPEVVAKPTVKRPKEDPKPAPQKDVPKVPKETNKNDSSVYQEEVDVGYKDISGAEKQQKKPSPVEKQVDEAKLKELKREEEITKAKQAMERKKKLAEKAAARAAVRAQKEAEKKLKEREKKQKKASASAPTDEADEKVGSEVAEPEKVEANDEVPVAVEKKARKENVRLRKQTRYAVTLPRANLRRKKATNYWLWAATAGLVVLVLLAVAYYLSSVKSAN